MSTRNTWTIFCRYNETLNNSYHNHRLHSSFMTKKPILLSIQIHTVPSFSFQVDYHSSYHLSYNHKLHFGFESFHTSSHSLLSTSILFCNLFSTAMQLWSKIWTSVEQIFVVLNRIFRSQQGQQPATGDIQPKLEAL